jgi:HD-GYP domain-containing protein (c-di-GMP phosphodiesterase class II)
MEQVTTDGVLHLGELAQHPTAERAVEAMREFLGMDVAYTTEFVRENGVLRILRGDGESFGGMAEGAQMPLKHTYCQRVLAGRLPNLIPDVRGDDRAASLPITAIANVGAYASVPLTFSDGKLYGTLCAGSHDAKPDLGYRDLQFLHVFARIVADQLEREMLQDRGRDLEIQAAAARTLIAAVQARDAYTGDHSEAVVKHAGAVARQLRLSDAEIAEVEQVALLHDIGKIAIPDAILRKPGELTDEEWNVMRSHPVSSERLITGVPGLGHLGSAIRGEHERWDGGGYPDGLAGEAIPLSSRITLVCDAYHAMVSDRPYRRAMGADAARAEIAAGAGTQFCPKAAQALLEVL